MTKSDIDPLCTRADINLSEHHKKNRNALFCSGCVDSIYPNKEVNDDSIVCDGVCHNSDNERNTTSETQTNAHLVDLDKPELWTDDNNGQSYWKYSTSKSSICCRKYIKQI